MSCGDDEASYCFVNADGRVETHSYRKSPQCRSSIDTIQGHLKDPWIDVAMLNFTEKGWTGGLFCRPKACEFRCTEAASDHHGIG